MRPELMNVLALAYLGDGVFEVYVREYLLVEKGIMKPDVLQREAKAFVSAKAQAAFMHEAIEKQWLSEEEIGIYKRGRNAKSRHVPKNTPLITYNQSTGFETLIGHLYLLKENDRIAEIFHLFKVFVSENEKKLRQI